MLLVCKLFVLFRWKMCNILIPCKCSTGRLAHYRTFFMFYELENTIMIRKCATLCTRKKTYTNVFSMYHFMFNVKVRYFWAAMICKLFFELRFTIVALNVVSWCERNCDVAVVYGIAQHVNSHHWVLF